MDRTLKILVASVAVLAAAPSMTVPASARDNDQGDYQSGRGHDNGAYWRGYGRGREDESRARYDESYNPDRGRRGGQRLGSSQQEEYSRGYQKGRQEQRRDQNEDD